jgi:hypothetical protein
MARETLFLVQAFSAGKGIRLNADPPIKCRSAETARLRVEGMVASKAGVVAFSTSGDPEAGDYDDEPTILFKSGRLPTAFEEA